MDKSLEDRLQKNLKGASAATVDALAKRIWRLPAERATVAIDLGISLGSVSLRAALEGLRAAPEVARALDPDGLRSWSEIGRRLAATSPDASVEFFSISAATLDRIPAEKQSIVLQLAARQAALSSRIALDSFKFAPEMIERIGDPRLASELLAICLELARHSVKHSWELLQAAPIVIEHLRAMGADATLTHRAVSLASSFAHRSGGAAADFFSRLPGAVKSQAGPALDRLFDEAQLYLDRSGGVALQYFIAGGHVLQIAGADAFERWSDLSRRVAFQGNAASYHFLKFSPAVIAELARRDRGPALVTSVLEVVHRLSEVNALAAIECFRAAPAALRSASIQQFERWAELGLELAGSNTRKVQAYYGLESRGSQESLKGGDGGLTLERVGQTLRLYVEGLTGRELAIASVQSVPEQSSIGDGSTIYLPSIVAMFETSEDNFRLFKVLSAHGAGQIEFGTYESGTGELRAAFRAIDDRYRGDEPRARAPRELGFTAALALFPDPSLASRVFTTVENGRVDARLRAAYRGIRRDLDFVRDKIFARRPPVSSLAESEAPFEMLLQAALGGGVQPDGLAVFGARAVEVEQVLAEYVRRERAAVADSVLATARIYDLFMDRSAGDGGRSKRNQPGSDDETGDDSALGGEFDPDAEQRPRSRPHASPSGQVAHWSQMADADLSDALDSIAGQAVEAPEQELEPGDVVFPYDEWDRELSDHRSRWCRVIERRGQRGSRTFVETVRSRYSQAISSIRYQFQMMRPENLRRVRGELDGEEFDLQAVIDHAVDRRATGRASDRLYVRKLRRERDVAVAFLLDMSSSTARAISRFPSQPYSHPGRRIIDIEKEGLVLMSEALEAVGDVYAMHGFSSEGRRNVKFFVFKDFSEPYSAEVEKRIGGISYMNNTRLGAAIRHSAAKLEGQEARTKLLIVLSDGRPYDHDYGDSRYAREDTKVALRQAKQGGITPFCITIDRESEDQLRDMYGEVGYTIIDDVLSLPERMPAIYRRLTT
jgi:nitric oxide reductase NorD protein